MPPTASGTAAASAPPNTQTSTRKLIGIASDSISSKSRCDCSVISTFTIASPPARTVTPALSWTSRSDRSFAYSCVLFSSPAIPATISPDLPSLLTNAARSGAGAVHSDVTDVTCGERIRSSTSSVPTSRATPPLAPSGAETTITICTSPLSNLSVSSSFALADSDDGSSNPQAHKLFATGTPKMPAATATSAATASIRRGTPMASCAMRCSTSPRAGGVASPTTVRGASALDRPMPPATGPPALRTS